MQAPTRFVSLIRFRGSVRFYGFREPACRVARKRIRTPWGDGSSRLRSQVGDVSPGLCLGCRVDRTPPSLAVEARWKFELRGPKTPPLMELNRALAFGSAFSGTHWRATLPKP
jgi:hypothetical protein